jgi:hypothetical protein
MATPSSPNAHVVLARVEGELDALQSEITTSVDAAIARLKSDVTQLRKITGSRSVAVTDEMKKAAAQAAAANVTRIGELESAAKLAPGAIAGWKADLAALTTLGSGGSPQ